MRTASSRLVSERQSKCKCIAVLRHTGSPDILIYQVDQLRERRRSENLGAKDSTCDGEERDKHPHDRVERCQRSVSPFPQDPLSAWTKKDNRHTDAWDAFRCPIAYISRNLPELREFGISSTKLCWYTDSVDNSFLVDFVPGRGGKVAVCSGGSGHGFKFLPILGQEVVKILEGRGSVTPYGRLWGWRSTSPPASAAVGDAKGKTRNGLGEGEAGPRVLSKLKMASPADWVFKSSADNRSSKL